MSTRKTLTLTGAFATLLLVSASLVAKDEETVTKVFAGKLGNVPGHTLTAEVVTYAPGVKSSIHHHAGSVFAYVLTGSIRSQNSATGEARIYEAGESFFEPPGSDHLVSENASTTESASLLAIHVAKDGAVLTKRGHAR